MSEFKSFLALEASAGSGKTFALSVRFIALILGGARINEILALTFTKKAANEMQKRIINTFLRLEDKSAEKEELSKLLGRDEQELLRLRDEKKIEFLRANLKISTFDSFFHQILRAFALNLGLSSDFQISKNDAKLRPVFLKILNKDELRDLAFYIVGADEGENFFNELERLYENAYFDENFMDKTFSLPSKDKIEFAYDELKNYALSLRQNNLSKSFKNEKLDLKSFLKSSFMKGEAKYLQDLEKNDPIFFQKKQKFFAELNEYALALSNYKIQKLLRLLSHFSQAKKISQQEQNKLSFADVAKRVYDLSSSELKELIYFRLDGHISHLLIDEFQDTSVLQYEILRPLISELVSGEGVRKKRSFFYVGDKKQSIYRFRKGKKELFDLVRLEFPQIERASLDLNYRSRPVLVDFINELFKDKIKNYSPQRAAGQGAQNCEGFVRVLSSDEEKLSQIKDKTLEKLLEQLRFLQGQGVGYDQSCILCWKNSDADMILEFLQKQNIPAYTQSSIELTKKASVKIIIEYIKYCIFGDEFYRVFLEDVLGFTPPKISLKLDKNIKESLVFLSRKLRLKPDLALIQFIEYAQGNLLDLIFRPCPLTIASEAGLGVAIMTVHKSKGLEFDHLIVLDSLSKPNSTPPSIMLEYELGAGWELVLRDPIRAATREENYVNFLAKLQAADAEDELNKLYVALTRAKYSLIIIKRNETLEDGRYPSIFNKYLSLKCEERGSLSSQPKERESGQKSWQASWQANLQESGQESGPEEGPPHACAPEEKLGDKLEERPEERPEESLEDFEPILPQRLDSPPATPPSPEIYFGNAFHFFMQNISLPSWENFAPLEARTRQDFRHFLDEAALADLFSRLKILRESAAFGGLLLGKKILREQLFSLGGQLGRVDLLLLSPDEDGGAGGGGRNEGENRGGGEALIIDYKTGLSFKDSHAEQVKNYKKALAKFLPGRVVRGFLLYCLEGRVELEEVR